MPNHKKPPTESVRIRVETLGKIQLDAARFNVPAVEVIEAMARLWFSKVDPERRKMMACGES